MFCFGIIPSDLIRSITVSLLGRNARLDFWGKLLQFCLTRTYRLYDKVGFSDETDRAYMIYMPGVTDRIKQLETELKAENSEKSGEQ